MKYINTLNEGERVNGIYFCKVKAAATTKNGKDYINLTLQDKQAILTVKYGIPTHRESGMILNPGIIYCLTAM